MLTDGRPINLIDDSDAVTAAIQKAVRVAIEEQYRAGLSITIWRDGQKVVVPPDEIPALLASYDDEGAAGMDAAVPAVSPPVSSPNR